MPDNQLLTLDDFADSLLREKNYSTLTDEMAEELKRDLRERAQNYVIAKIITRLSDDQAKELSSLLDTSPSDQQLQEFIQRSIPDAPKFIGETLFEFRQTYLGLK